MQRNLLTVLGILPPLADSRTRHPPTRDLRPTFDARWIAPMRSWGCSLHSSVFDRRTVVIRPNAPVGPAPYNVPQLVVSASRPRTQNPEFPHPIHLRLHQPWMLVRRNYLPGLQFWSCDEGTYGLCTVRESCMDGSSCRFRGHWYLFLCPK